MTRRSSMPPLSPVLLVAGANALTGLTLSRRWGPGGVLFVHHVGFRSHYDVALGGSSWPVPHGDDCDDLARFAEARSILSAGPPSMGDLFLLWSKKARQFERTGIVAFVERVRRPASGRRSFSCRTIEAFTPDSGRYDGVNRQRRRFAPARGDRFVRWVDLDPRAALSDPLSAEQVNTATIRLQHAA